MSNFVKKVLINGVDLNSIIHVVGVNKPLMANKENRVKEVNAVHGSRVTGSKFKSFTMTVDFALIGSEEEQVSAKRQLSKLLLSSPNLRVEIDTEPDCYYEAAFEGEIAKTDKHYDQHTVSSFNLYVSRPFAFSKEESVINFTNGESVINLDTAIGTEPRIEIIANEDLASLSIVGPREVFTLGTPIDIETETVVNVSPYILNDEMAETSSWSTYTNTTNWTVQGEPYTNGWSFTQTKNEETGKPDYGTGSKWHGFAVSKALSEHLQDFEATFKIEMTSLQAKNIGRIEILGFDPDGKQLFTMALVDSSDTAFNTRFEVIAGNSNTMTSTIVNSVGNDAKVWAEFKGILKLTRVGLKYKAYIENQTGGKAHSRLSKEKTFVSVNPFKNKLASVVIRIGAFGTKTPPATLAVHDLKIKKLGTPGEGEIDAAIKAGDSIVIDSETGQVFKNEDLWMTDIYELSEFVKLQPGVNALQIVPSESVSASIKFRKRFI